MGDGAILRHWLGWRAMLALAAAMLAPLAIYILITAAVYYRDEQMEAEERTLAKARQIIGEVDSRAEASSATMRALATIPSIRNRTWPVVEGRFQEIARLQPDWRGVALLDRKTGREQADFGDCDGLSSIGHLAGMNPDDWNDGAVRYSNITAVPGGNHQLEATLGLAGTAGEQYVLVVCIDPAVVQKALLSVAPRGGVSAVVDRSGRFIARTQGWPERLGTPATKYVRGAIARSKSGLYHGVTWEGLDNYTAFATSDRTGWSAHVAVSSATMDSPRQSWRLTTAFAALISIAMAATISFGIFRLAAIRRAGEKRAAQAERLESIGRLTGGIAHDFNNMLAIVIGSLELVKRRLDRGEMDVTRFVDNAIDGAQRAADLTRRLLAFSRRQPLAPATIDANVVIDGTAKLMERALPANISVCRELASDLWPTLADPGELENALVNLMINARDAMPDGGTLILRSENRPASNENEVDQIAVTVADSGVGMPPEVIARAFDPFFTTKATGRGTGLGLSQIHGFAAQSGGDVLIDSRPGEGTQITIVLPRQEAASSNRSGAISGANQGGLPLAGTGEVVLVVEDEDRLRQTTVEALIGLGYRAIEAHDGESALACLATERRIDLLFSDIVMPGMSGRKLAEQAVQVRPNLAVLLTTGYEREPHAQDNFAILPKPFSLSELAHKVRQSIDSVMARQSRD